jgi:lipid-binding SYLF domain-containing protein
MKTMRRRFLGLALAVAAAASIGSVESARAASASEIDHNAHEALRTLYRTNPVAEKIGGQARAILVFPKIVKAGLVVGGSYGEGELIRQGQPPEYFNSVSASWGLQAGAQSYGYVVFLMNNKAVRYLHRTQGWEIGVGPTVVIVNEGLAKNLSTSTLKDDAYAFIFDQQGLMASISIEGSKVSHINPKE